MDSSLPVRDRRSAGLATLNPHGLRFDPTAFGQERKAMTPEVHYAKCGDVHVAYLDFGVHALKGVPDEWPHYRAAD